jgi:sphingosine kinase
MKVEAYRIKPYGHGHFSVDGELIPFEETQVEVHRGMGTLLSPYGRYFDDFKSPLSPPVE